MKNSVKLMLAIACLALAVTTYAAAPDNANSTAQIVALDECDPITFNAALGADFCRNVALGALGFSTTLQDLFAKAAAGKPDPGWTSNPTRSS